MSDGLILAITNIGDLLLDNSITRGEDGNSITGINLKIPKYQRPYKWTAKNVIQLLDDIVEAKNENKEIYRVGTLILHQDQEVGAEEKIYNIVDGQQRIITFSLLLKALHEVSKIPLEDERIKVLDQPLADKDSGIKFLNQPLADNPFNRRNVPANYRTLKRRVNNISDDRGREELCDYIKKNCELIVVITTDVSEAFQFFDSQNARGKKLYPHDLLKAYHLREMANLDVEETEKVVKTWEDLDQKELSFLFSEYLYSVKEWTKDNWAWGLTEHNIHIFKGITRQDNFPYAMFYKGAYAYAESVNHSAMPFVSGMRNLKPFQLDAPIIAGKPFFDYAKHYFEILKDIQNNNKYEGYYINDNEIIKTLDLGKYRYRRGDQIARFLLDTAILLYVDRFCPEPPTPSDSQMLDQFVVFAFIWAYSLRIQYDRLGWPSAQNFIMGISRDIVNSFNMYKVITESDSPTSLLSELSDRLNPLLWNENWGTLDEIKKKDENGVYQNYLHYFNKHQFIIWRNTNSFTEEKNEI